jgi:hypothetical protein
MYLQWVELLRIPRLDLRVLEEYTGVGTEVVVTHVCDVLQAAEAEVDATVLQRKAVDVRVRRDRLLVCTIGCS